MVLLMPSPQTAEAKQPSNRPWLAFALTFLLLGLGYALPITLVRTPPSGIWPEAIAPEILNLYALTAFAGWAHFVFSYRGQWMATQRMRSSSRALYWATLGLVLAVFIALRHLIGVAIFSALVWVWFIGHFVKAETVFAGAPVDERTSRWSGFLTSRQPVMAFAWLSAVLFNVGEIEKHRWVLFGVTLALSAAMLLSGGWRQLAQGDRKLPVISFFFLGESLVWGTYGPYMTPAFRIGVYVFHVAGASFFHYLGSYAYGYERTGDRWLRLGPVTFTNLVLIFLGSTVARNAWTATWFRDLFSPVLGISWFTVWVALHLAASDLLPLWKRRFSILPSSTFSAVSAGR
jgi:hypothetical protein